MRSVNTSKSEGGARNVLRVIESTVRFLREHPYASEQTDYPPVRMKVVVRYRYKIFYRIREDLIEILHVRHGSRRPWEGER